MQLLISSTLHYQLYPMFFPHLCPQKFTQLMDLTIEAYAASTSKGLLKPILEQFHVEKVCQIRISIII